MDDSSADFASSNTNAPIVGDYPHLKDAEADGHQHPQQRIIDRHIFGGPSSYSRFLHGVGPYLSFAGTSVNAFTTGQSIKRRFDKPPAKLTLQSSRTDSAPAAKN